MCARVSVLGVNCGQNFPQRLMHSRVDLDSPNFRLPEASNYGTLGEMITFHESLEASLANDR